MIDFFLWLLGIDADYFVIEKMKLHNRNAAIDSNTAVVEFSGRQGGLFQLLLSIFGIHTRANFTLTPQGAKAIFENPTSGFSAMTFLPLQQKPTITIKQRYLGIFEIIFWCFMTLTGLIPFVVPGLIFFCILLLRWITVRGFLVQLRGHSRLAICFYQSIFQSEVVQHAQLCDAMDLMRDYILASTHETPINEGKSLNDVLGTTQEGVIYPLPPDPLPPPPPTWDDMWNEIHRLGEQQLPGKFYRDLIKCIDIHFEKRFHETCKSIFETYKLQLGPNGHLAPDHIFCVQSFLDLLERLPPDQQGGKPITPLIESVGNLLTANR